MLEPHTSASDLKLCVCVRKRPLFEKELEAGENDAVSVANPQIKVHAPKLRIDGITKYIDNTMFTFDNTFNHKESTDDVYSFSLKKLLPDIFNKSYITMFAYGQTGSGKTFTMVVCSLIQQGITANAVSDLYKIASKKKDITFGMSFFEIYGGRCFDLLNKQKRVEILEDGNNEVTLKLKQGSNTGPERNSSFITRRNELGNRLGE